MYSKPSFFFLPVVYPVYDLFRDRYRCMITSGYDYDIIFPEILKAGVVGSAECAHLFSESAQDDFRLVNGIRRQGVIVAITNINWPLNTALLDTLNPRFYDLLSSNIRYAHCKDLLCPPRRNVRKRRGLIQGHLDADLKAIECDWVGTI